MQCQSTIFQIQDNAGRSFVRTRPFSEGHDEKMSCMIAERILHEYVFWQRAHSHGALRFVSLHSCIIIATHGFPLEYIKSRCLAGHTMNWLLVTPSPQVTRVMALRIFMGYKRMCSVYPRRLRFSISSSNVVRFKQRHADTNGSTSARLPACYK